MTRNRIGLIGLAALAVALVVSTGAFRGGGPGPVDDLAGMFTLAPPAFASGLNQVAPPFPDPDIGLSAFVQLESITLDDLDSLVSNLFLDLRAGGDNFVIGNVGVQGFFARSDVYLYADTEGWLVGYILKEQDGAHAIQFFGTALNGCTVQTPPGTGALPAGRFGSGVSALECAMGQAAALLEQQFPQDPSAIGWYHWEFPDATHLGAAVQTRGSDTPINLYFAVPTNAVWKDASVLAGTANLSDNIVLLRLDGAELLISTPTNKNTLIVIPLEEPFPTTGLAHTIQRPSNLVSNLV